MAAKGRLLGLSNRAESRKEGMSAGKQLIMGQRCKQAVRERGKDLGPGLSKKPQTACRHDGMAGLALSAALCGFRRLAVTSLWTCLGGLCTHQEGEVAMPVSGLSEKCSPAVAPQSGIAQSSSFSIPGIPISLGGVVVCLCLGSGVGCSCI